MLFSLLSTGKGNESIPRFHEIEGYFLWGSQIPDFIALLNVGWAGSLAKAI